MPKHERLLRLAAAGARAAAVTAGSSKRTGGRRGLAVGGCPGPAKDHTTVRLSVSCGEASVCLRSAGLQLKHLVTI